MTIFPVAGAISRAAGLDAHRPLCSAPALAGERYSEKVDAASFALKTAAAIKRIDLAPRKTWSFPAALTLAHRSATASLCVHCEARLGP